MCYSCLVKRITIRHIVHLRYLSFQSHGFSLLTKVPYPSNTVCTYAYEITGSGVADSMNGTTMSVKHITQLCFLNVPDF